jgi:hypothetical protein
MNGLDLEFRQHSITSQQQKSRTHHLFIKYDARKKHPRLSRAYLSPTDSHAHFENEAKHKQSARCIVRDRVHFLCALSKESASENKILLLC